MGGIDGGGGGGVGQAALSLHRESLGERLCFSLPPASADPHQQMGSRTGMPQRAGGFIRLYLVKNRLISR